MFPRTNLSVWPYSIKTQPGQRSCTTLDTSVQVGLFLGCVSCHSSAEVFFLLNFFFAEGGCEVFGLKDLADLYVGLAFVGTALDPLDGLFERLDLPEPEAGSLLSVKGPSVTVQFLPEKWTRAPLEEG